MRYSPVLDYHDSGFSVRNLRLRSHSIVLVSAVNACCTIRHPNLRVGLRIVARLRC